jgi:hypothetical protein
MYPSGFASPLNRPFRFRHAIREVEGTLACSLRKERESLCRTRCMGFFRARLGFLSHDKRRNE